MLSLWRPVAIPPGYRHRRFISHQFIKVMLDWALKTKHKNVGLSLPSDYRYHRTLGTDYRYHRTIATTGLLVPTIATTGLSLPPDYRYHRTNTTTGLLVRIIATTGLSLPPYCRYQRTVDEGKRPMNEWELSVSNHGAQRPQKSKGLLGTGKMGGRGYGVWGVGRLYTYRYTVTTRTTSALRWAAMTAIFTRH